MRRYVGSAKRAVSGAVGRLLYGPLTPLYDAFTWAISLGHWRRWQLAALSHVEGPRVLELGSGPGHLLAAMAAMAARGHTCCALDNSTGMLKQARRNVARQGARPGVARGLAQHLPFSSGSFDTVVMCFSGLAWLPQVVGECRRVLGPSGLLVVVDEVFFAKRGPRTAFVKAAMSLFDGEEESTPHDAPLRDAGFDVRVVDEPVDGDVVRVMLGRAVPSSQ